MALLENLAQGFANAAGATDAAQGIQKVKDDRQATQHEELEGKSRMIWDDVKRLQDRRAALDPKSPSYKTDLADIDSSLEKHQQAFVDLYHPAKNPGALAKLGGFLRSHMGGQKAPQVPSTPAQAKQSMAQLQASAAGPGQTQVNPLEQKVKDLVAIGVPKEEAVRIASGQKEPAQHPTWKQFKVGDQVRWYDLNDKDSIPPDAQPIQAGAQSKPKTAWTKGKDGRPVSVQLDANNQVIPGSENPNVLPPASLTGRLSTSFYHTVDEQGNVHQIQETRTSMPMTGGGGAAPSAPAKHATPGELKDKAKPSGDKIIGHKETPVQAKAHTAYVDAYRIAQKADDVEKKPNDAVNQKRLAVALERQAAGRFTTQALDYIKKAGLGNSIEEWANSATTGALPKEVMRQLIDGAHQERDASYKAWQESKKGSDDSGESEEDKFLKQIK